MRLLFIGCLFLPLLSPPPLYPLSHLFSSVVSHSLGRGRISCSQVGWFLGGARRPDSRLKPAGVPPDTMYVKPRTRKNVFSEDPACSREMPARGSQSSHKHRAPQRTGEPQAAWHGDVGSGPGCPGNFPITIVSSKLSGSKPSRRAMFHPSRCSLQSWLCLRGSY